MSETTKAAPGLASLKESTRSTPRQSQHHSNWNAIPLRAISTTLAIPTPPASRNSHTMTLPNSQQSKRRTAPRNSHVVTNSNLNCNSTPHRSAPFQLVRDVQRRLKFPRHTASRNSHAATNSHHHQIGRAHV